MTSVSNIAIGAHLAGNAAAKARHGMNDAIGRLSTGIRGLYGGDACGAAGAIQYRAEGKVLMSLHELKKMVSLFYKHQNLHY